MIKDLTDIFRKGILNSADYNPKSIKNKLETLPDIWCRFDDDSLWNWYWISKGKDYPVIEESHDFFSSPFPACLLKYCPNDIRKQLEENGILIKDKEYGVIENYGVLSKEFPVALLMENCPNNIRQLLEENGIFTDDFSRKCSCDEEILKQYAPQSSLRIIDDRKLLDGRISFDSQEFITICSFHYLSPYDFDFY
ncbi:MAG: hypothetical protein K2F73_03815, partial [Ruminococcus sp.]|nr:hypothetical protein [Ruminococcus sp.]